MTARLWSRHRAVLAALVCAVVAVSALVPGTGSADANLGGSAGVDAGLPPTDSVMTKPGRGNFAGLQVTVSQTADLGSQALSVSWSGGAPTLGGPRFDGNFLQIFQCWGDDGSGTGPPPQQCEFGGLISVPGRFPVRAQTTLDVQRNSPQPRSEYDPSQGLQIPPGCDDTTGCLLEIPFRSVDGKVFERQQGSQLSKDSSAVEWLNTKYDAFSTNEIDLARTYQSGKGSELFQVATDIEASGLGCGAARQTDVRGVPTIPKCWLVVVPRGTPDQENPPGADPRAVQTSPLAPKPWANRIVFPLQFNPLASPCVLGAKERAIVGSELADLAASSWQPRLCLTPGSPPYSYSALSDLQARRQLVSGAAGAPGMAVMSRPLDPAILGAENPVTYAPLTLSAPVIALQIQRVAQTDPMNGNNAFSDEAPIEGTRVLHVNLTPRLVAKLLTQSYPGQFPFDAYASEPWLNVHPTDLLEDPDFLQYNPEFKHLNAGNHKYASVLQVEESTSDAAYQIWQWVLADPEAGDWLAGTPDRTGCPPAAPGSPPCGMTVNPNYSTSPRLNPSGVAFGSPIPTTFPKSDPYCHKDNAVIGDPSLNPPQHPRPLCLQDYTPYSGSFQDAARRTLIANDGAKTSAPGTDSGPGRDTPSTYWGSDGPQIQGSRTVLSVTDSASAARFGLQTARLSRAGDDTAGRSFIAPDAAGLQAGVQAMVPSAVPSVLEPSPAHLAAGAYPLTALTYAAVTPRRLDAAARNDYAAFVDFATGEGQAPGFHYGNLPPGYVPLPDNLRAQARAAAAVIRSGDPAPPGPAETAVKAAGAARSPGGGAQAGGSAATTPGDISSTNAGPVVGGPPPLSFTTRQNGKSASLQRTLADAVGLMRYTLPVVIVAAILAGLGAWCVERRRRKTGPAVARAPGGGAAPLAPLTPGRDRRRRSVPAGPRLD